MEIKIIRKIDNLGRIVIPKDIRMTLGIDAFDCIEISLEKTGIVLKKASVSEKGFSTIEK